MKILLILWTFSLISGAVKAFSVTGYSGGNLLVDSGKIWFSDRVKYMAKLPEWRTIINDTRPDGWINVGRFTLFQNNEGNLMIFIRDLNQEDAGRYAIDVLQNKRIYMNLTMKEDSCCKASKTVMVNPGKTASFSCEYSQSHINDTKMVFKEGKDSIETIYSTRNTTERFNISDDRDRTLLRVTLTDVRAEDGGVYLCGVWINRHSYSYSIITTVHLHVINSSMILLISVCVIPLLIAGLALAVCKLRHQSQGDAHTHSPVHSQLPTIPSDELLYTAISFQRNEDAVAFSKDSIHCDYTAVVYSTGVNWLFNDRDHRSLYVTADINVQTSCGLLIYETL